MVECFSVSALIKYLQNRNLHELLRHLHVARDLRLRFSNNKRNFCACYRRCRELEKRRIAESNGMWNY